MFLKRRLLFFIGLTIFLSILFIGNIEASNAQPPSYGVGGVIGANGVVWHNLYNINEGDLVLVSISGTNVFDSKLFYPNQTLSQSIDFSRMHIYQFNASQSGTYLLRLESWNGQTANYSITSTHQIEYARLMTPYGVGGVIGANGVVWHNLYNIKKVI